MVSFVVFVKCFRGVVSKMYLKYDFKMLVKVSFLLYSYRENARKHYFSTARN